jgi:hypothetical protein
VRVLDGKGTLNLGFGAIAGRLDRKLETLRRVRVCIDVEDVLAIDGLRNEDARSRVEERVGSKVVVRHGQAVVPAVEGDLAGVLREGKGADRGVDLEVVLLEGKRRGIGLAGEVEARIGV